MDTTSPIASDKAIETFSHVGWIPCISGHLDFCLMSVGLVGNYIANKVDTRPVTINYAASNFPDSHCRRVIMQSWVDWRDQLSGDGKFRVISVAECTSSGNLDAREMKGTLVMFPKEYNKKYPEHHNIIFNKINTASKIINDYRNLPASDPEKILKWSEYQSALNNAWEELKFLLVSNHLFGEEGREVYLVDYYIDHYGFSYFNYRNTEIDEEFPLKSYEKYLIVRQAFYYIKYSLHKHKHHTQESDALTTVIPTAGGRAEIALQLLGQLKRELVRIKRTQRQNFRRQDDSEAIGVLGYMRSLLSSLKDDNFITDRIYIREKDWIRGMEISFGAQNERIKAKVSRKENANLASRQWMAYILAFFTAVCVIWINTVGKKFESTTSPLYSDTINILVNNFHWSALGVFVLLFVTGKITMFYSLLDIEWPRLVRKIRVISWPTTISILLIYMVATSLVLLSLYSYVKGAVA